MVSGIKVYAAGMAGWYALTLLGQVQELAAFSSWIQYGALGILGLTVLGQLWIIIVSLREAFNRMDRWEQQRHEDHAALSETLSQLRENCAVANAKRSVKS